MSSAIRDVGQTLVELRRRGAIQVPDGFSVSGRYAGELRKVAGL